MIALWMVYSVAVGALLAAAAWLLDRALQLARVPTRAGWMLALLATAGLSTTAPFRAETMRIKLPAVQVVESKSGPVAVDVAQSWHAWLSDAVRTFRESAEVPLHGAGVLLQRLGTNRVSDVLGVAWLIASAALLLIFGFTAWRARRLRHGWPLQTLCGEPVRVAPAAGPLTTGLLRPEVVVPAWLLAAPQPEQRLVLAHEREHQRTRDPLLLAAGCAVAALLPWNPAVWWMLARMRLAVEVDCDARVLRSGASRGAYGSVLLDVAARHSGGLFGAPAFFGPPSHLERRIVAMTNSKPAHAHLRTMALSALSGTLLLAACEAKVPSSAEIEQMDVAAAEVGAESVGLVTLGDNSNVVYTIDGVEVTAAEARALNPQQIAAVEVQKDASGERGTVMIWTNKGLAARGEATPQNAQKVGRVQVSEGEDGTAARRVTIRGDGGAASPGAATVDVFDGIFVIDGKRVDPKQMRKLSPDAIASVEVVKGAAAAQLYADPAAVNGVIRITTKKAAGGR